MQILNQLGTIEYVVAPNLAHHVFLDDFLKLYPTSKVIAPDGMKSNHPNISSYLLLHDEDANYNGLTISRFGFDPQVIDYAYFPAFSQKEVWLFHRPTRTALCADMFWSLPANEQYSHAHGQHLKKFQHKGFVQRLVEKCESTKSGMLRGLEWMITKDTDQFEAQMSKILTIWQPNTLICEHGDIIAENALLELHQVYEWVLGSKLVV